MSLNKDQLALINTVFAAFDIEVPEISKDVTSDLLKAFAAFTKGFTKGSSKGSSKDASKKSKKVKDPNAPKRPVNAYFAWLALNRALLKAQNGGSEDGLADLLKSEYEKFKQTPAYQKLKKECEEKMKVYKEEMSEYTSEDSASESPSEDEDDSKGKKKKAKKVEKSPEEKQPPNVYMTYRNVHLQSIKENLKEGQNLAEVLKEKYEEFKSTKEYNTLQEKCKADFAKWKAGSDSDEAPKKKTAAKKTVEVEVTSDSDDDDDTFTMSKPKAAPEKAPKKTQPKKEKNKKAAKKVDSDDEE
jgi:hypothetical protein